MLPSSPLGWGTCFGCSTSGPTTGWFGCSTPGGTSGRFGSEVPFCGSGRLRAHCVPVASGAPREGTRVGQTLAKGHASLVGAMQHPARDRSRQEPTSRHWGRKTARRVEFSQSRRSFAALRSRNRVLRLPHQVQHALASSALSHHSAPCIRRRRATSSRHAGPALLTRAERRVKR